MMRFLDRLCVVCIIVTVVSMSLLVLITSHQVDTLQAEVASLTQQVKAYKVHVDDIQEQQDALWGITQDVSNRAGVRP